MRKFVRIICGMNTAVIETPKSLRARHGLRQADLAEKAQVALRTVSEIDAGHDVSVRSIRRVARVLDVSPGLLVDAMERERALRRRMNLDRNLSSRSDEFKKGGGS